MYLSGPALEGAFAARMYSQIAERPAAHQIFELAAAKEPLAIAVVKEHQRQLAKFIANLSNLLDLDYIVFGGGLSKQPAIYEGLEALIARDTYTPGYSPKIYKHQLGDSAGGIGAALLCV
jgi:fructokinase